MTRGEWLLIGVAVLFIGYAVYSYSQIDLSAGGAALNQPTSGQMNSIYQATARFSPDSDRVGFNLSGGFKL